MLRPLLQELADDFVRWDALPPAWSSFNVAEFSAKKEMWDYQQKALERAVKGLWQYYEGFADYQRGESLETNVERNRKLMEWYRRNGLEGDLSLPLARTGHRLRRLLDHYFDTSNDRLDYENYINRMCFWMATGSGKTLVLVKLIQILKGLIEVGEIPPNDILVLTYRDDLIAQLKEHVDEFNRTHRDCFIRLRELREYPEVKRCASTFSATEVTVFYYRSDLMNDEKKEKIVDFRNYDDNGKWYVMLDEAHKGDKEDSKRQHIYAILARNGFLFNFSATFTDPRDVITTVSNFNLSEFIKAGYGKHIAILEQTFRAFRDDEDYSGDEKQRIVLKSLMLLAYAAKHARAMRKVRAGMYHAPMLMTLVNSVNVEDADLKLFFRELARIGKGDVDNETWQKAWAELCEELAARPKVMFEDQSIVFDEAAFRRLKLRDILRLVFNAESGGNVEVLQRSSDKKELAFKLKSSDVPFALVKIGDVTGWLKDELTGYEVSQRFEDESYFEQLNRPNSSVNILMGSRSFYEGWDSNRPNVINYINIGTGTDARKFILQSVGRGVRIEPVVGQRQRLRILHRGGVVDDATFEATRDKAPALETLFILGTNHQALQTVISEMQKEGGVGERHQMSLFLNPEAKQRMLLVPTYQPASAPLAEQKRIAKYDIDEKELGLLRQYGETTDARVLVARHGIEPRMVRLLTKSLANADDFYSTDGPRVKNLDVLSRRVFSHLGIVPDEFDRLKPMTDEIRHYQNIVVELKDISELTDRVREVSEYRDPEAEERELDALLDRDKIGRKAYKERLKKLARRQPNAEFVHDGRKLFIEHVANHYYVPMLLTKDEKVDYIKHAIRHESEVRFVRSLQQNIGAFSSFDWWMFSKIDESLDSIWIPWYDVTPRKFYPDFIFWLQKDNRYIIAFVDPKGTAFAQYMHKLDGYRMLFEEYDKPRVIPHEGLKVQVLAVIFPKDMSKVPKDYRRNCVDSIGGLVRKLRGHNTYL